MAFRYGFGAVSIQDRIAALKAQQQEKLAALKAKIKPGDTPVSVPGENTPISFITPAPSVVTPAQQKIQEIRERIQERRIVAPGPVSEPTPPPLTPAAPVPPLMPISTYEPLVTGGQIGVPPVQKIQEIRKKIQEKIQERKTPSVLTPVMPEPSASVITIKQPTSAQLKIAEIKEKQAERLQRIRDRRSITPPPPLLYSPPPPPPPLTSTVPSPPTVVPEDELDVNEDVIMTPQDRLEELREKNRQRLEEIRDRRRSTDVEPDTYIDEDDYEEISEGESSSESEEDLTLTEQARKRQQERLAEQKRKQQERIDAQKLAREEQRAAREKAAEEKRLEQEERQAAQEEARLLRLAEQEKRKEEQETARLERQEQQRLKQEELKNRKRGAPIPYTPDIPEVPIESPLLPKDSEDWSKWKPQRAGLFSPGGIGDLFSGFNIGQNWPILATMGIGLFLILKGKRWSVPEPAKKKGRRKRK